MQSAASRRRRDSVVLNVNDPVAMHLLVETAIADSANYNILTYEELEQLKKELQMSTSRVSALKRKLVLETKLQEAASSLNRLPSSGRTSSEGTRPDSPNVSAKNDESSTGPGQSRKSTTTEPIVSSDKAREMSQKLTKEEAENFRLRRRLLEHTAGVLQLTYNGDGLQHSRANPYGGSSLDDRRDRHKLGGNMTPESMANDFNEESLYREADILNDADTDNDGKHKGFNSDSSVAARDTEEKLRTLSHRMYETLQESGVDSGLLTPPEDVADINTHLAYLGKSIESIPKADKPGNDAANPSGDSSEELIISASTRINEILEIAASSPAEEQRDPTSIQHIDDLNLALEQLEKHVANLSEQKAILTRQIQQQRELNEKSDAERDEYIADLQGEIAMFENELEVAKGEVNSAQERIAQFEKEIELQGKTIKEYQQKEAQNQKEKPHDSFNESDDDVEGSKEITEHDDPSKSPVYLAELEEMRAKLSLHREAAEKLQRDLDAKEFESDTHREARLSLEEQVAMKEEEISQHKEALDEFVRQSIDTQNEMDSLKQENASKNRELSEKVQLLEACIKKLEKVTPEIAARIASVENDDDRLTRDEELRDLRESIEDAERQLTNKEAESKVYIEKLSDLERAVENHEHALSAAVRAAIASKADIETLRLAKEEAETALASSQEQMASHDDQIRQLNQFLEAKEQEIQQLKTSTSCELPPAELIADPAALEKLETLQARITESDAKISHLEAALATAGAAEAYTARTGLARRTDMDGKDSTLPRARGIIDSSYTLLASDSTSTTELRQHIQMMETELHDTIEDYEELVKASVEFEREREHLDKVIDHLREKCEKLEVQMNEKQLEEVANGEGGEHAQQQISIRVLKEEFKRIMRESRKENLKVLKLEQEERKRLEAMVQSLRRGSRSQVHSMVPERANQDSGGIIQPTQG
ncbi:AP-3 complex subunit beta [Ascosphaera pollenicola]|nr:AP-3 complex subunit beta [Ascosphaera pollenicola]